MDKLKSYQELVKRYHNTLDLVSNVALEQFDQKIADSLVYADVIRDNLKPGATVLDVGSGAGLPGLVMAIELPEYSFHLVEKRQKRSAFLKIAASQLGLENVKIYLADVTELKDIQADAVTALAVGTFKLLYCLTRQLHDEEILLMSRKGNDYQREIKELEQSLSIRSEIIANIPLKTNQASPNPSNVSRETIYGSLIAIKLLGGLECASV
jgi:16S rRNA (guanine527-N7)-methyltransferase